MHQHYYHYYYRCFTEMQVPVPVGIFHSYGNGGGTERIGLYLILLEAVQLLIVLPIDCERVYACGHSMTVILWSFKQFESNLWAPKFGAIEIDEP